MNNQRRRWGYAHPRGAAVALAALTALGLAACSSGSAGAGSSSAGGKVQITLSMQNPNVQQQDPATYAIVQAFQKANPDITVKIEGQTVDEHEKAMQVAAQSGTLPDIFWVYNSLASQMAQQGKLLDLGPVLQEGNLTSNFPKAMLSGYTSSGTQYGVPYQSLVTGLYVNAAILQKYGLSEPKTFDDLLNVAQVLSKNGVTTIAQGASKSAYSVWAFLTMLDRFGYEDKYQDILSGKSSYNNADFLRLYQHIEQLAKAGAFSKNVSTQTYVQAVEEYTSGNAAMLDSGVWAAGDIQKSSVAANTTFWAGPTFSDGVGDQNLYMNAPSAPLVVSAEVKKSAAKLDAVKKFMAFYYGDSGQQILVDNAQTPVTTYKPKVDASAQPVFASVLAVLQQDGWHSPAAQPDLVVSAETSSAMYDSIYGVIQGVYSPSQALDVVQKTIH